MPFFSKKYKLGIDIGSSLIKICFPSRSGRPLVLRFPTPAGMVSKGVLHQSEEFVDSLRHWFGKHQLSHYPVVTTLPASTLVLRHIQIPKLKPKESAEAIEWEARRVLPFPLEEAQIDWLYQGNEVLDEGEMQNVLLVAVRDSIVQRYASVITDAGLKLVALDIAPMALGRWLLKDAIGSTMIIDIGAETTQVHFFEDKKLIFSRSLTIGGDQATKSIASNNGISFDEAEAKKLRGEYQKDSLDAWHMELGRELQRSLDYYRGNFAEHMSDGFQRVILSGGASLTKGIESLIRELSKIEPGYAEYSSRGRSPQHDRIIYNVALGAGMWEG